MNRAKYLARRMLGKAARLAGLRRAVPVASGSPPADLDPLTQYEALRLRGPVVHLPGEDSWVVLGEAEAKQVFKDWRRFSNAPYEPIDIALLSADAPRHTAIRQVLNRHFAPAVLDRISASAAILAASLVKPAFDVVADYARPLSHAVASDLIGFDSADRGTMTAATLESHTAPDSMTAQFAAMDGISHRSALYQAVAQEGAELLAGAEIRSLLRLMWIASTVTSERLIANCVLRLLMHPVERDRLRRNPGLLAAAVDETARLHPPEPLLLRRANEPVEIGGVTVPAGALVKICLPAANRDPARFSEPEAFRLDRGAGRNIAFGAGPHHCIGMALARRSLDVAIGTLLRDMPDFRSATPDLPAPTALAPAHLRIVA